MLNDTCTSRYIHDKFAVDNQEFEKHVPDIQSAELELNKSNTSDKHFLPEFEYIKVIRKINDMHTNVYDKCDDFEFPSPAANFTWLDGNVLRSTPTPIVRHLVHFAIDMIC